MTLDELILHNFGVYKGRQIVQLGPPSPDKPVVLVGGLNGGGKTTLLDALLLTLYGKLARPSNRGTMAYSDFLEHCINRDVDPGEGAGLELAFRHVMEGRESHFRVIRTWRKAGKSVRETLEVLRNGESDPLLTEQWAEFMEELLPGRIAHLFFFDGEKIEGFADPTSASDLLAVAVHSLLGLDLVDQLVTDLVALERRKRIEVSTRQEQEEINERVQRVESLETERRRCIQERGAAQNDGERRAKKLAEAEQRFRASGGHLYERRVELEAERSRIQEQLALVEEDLRTLAAGPAPFLLVRDMLSEVLEQADAETKASSADLVIEILEERDEKVLRLLRDFEAPSDVIDATTDLLTEERTRRRLESDVPRYLELSREGHAQLLQLMSGTLDEVEESARKLVARAEELQGALDEQDRLLAAIPETAAIAVLVEKREEARTSLAAIEEVLQGLDEQISRVDRELAHYKTRLAASLERQVQGEFKRRDASRTMEHSRRSRKTLKRFRKAVVERHVDRISGYVLESFQHLLRKDGLVTDLRIDPTTFELKLIGPDGQELTPSRLSAGERQLLAVSILWGLARASGRPLPVIVDTPMGRLDSEHRAKLVDRYFPHASHQIILLSTDEEINEAHLETLNDRIGRSYELAYDNSTQSTTVRSGYFWQRSR